MSSSEVAERVAERQLMARSPIHGGGFGQRESLQHEEQRGGEE